MSKKQFKTTITKKGQMTIPKSIREELHLKTGYPAELEFNEENGSLKIKRGPDLLDLKGSFEVPEGKNALKAREYMENNYERV